MLGRVWPCLGILAHRVALCCGCRRRCRTIGRSAVSSARGRCSRAHRNCSGGRILGDVRSSLVALACAGRREGVRNGSGGRCCFLRPRQRGSGGRTLGRQGSLLLVADGDAAALHSFLGMRPPHLGHLLPSRLPALAPSHKVHFPAHLLRLAHQLQLHCEDVRWRPLRHCRRAIDAAQREMTPEVSGRAPNLHLLACVGADERWRRVCGNQRHDVRLMSGPSADNLDDLGPLLRCCLRHQHTGLLDLHRRRDALEAGAGGVTGAHRAPQARRPRRVGSVPRGRDVKEHSRRRARVDRLHHRVGHINTPDPASAVRYENEAVAVGLYIDASHRPLATIAWRHPRRWGWWWGWWCPRPLVETTAHNLVRIAIALAAGELHKGFHILRLLEQVRVGQGRQES
mmetsp:Transcript_45394/g.97016  ORF Transcript_45394/g.97016 Transcript_45394/m.97016 type:complete len:399 (+) Transcript_45394:651-1847(+)